jgi:hypothetical protein
MAELNFGLLTPPGSQSIGNAFVSGMDQAAVARAQENQNALAQYTLSKARREDELTNQLLGDLRSATTNDEIYRAYQRAGKGDVASKLQSDALTRQKLTGEIAAQPTALAAAQTKLVADKLAESRSMLEGVSTPEEYIAWHEANHADPIIGKALAARGITAEQSRKRIEEALKTPGGLEQLINESKVGVAKFAEMNKPSNVSQTLGGSVRTLAIPGMGGAATVVPGSVGTVTAAPSTDAAMLSASVRFNPETGSFQNVAPAGMSMRPPSAAGAAPQGFPAGSGVQPIAAPIAAQSNAMIPSAQPSVNAMRPGAAPTAAPAATSGYSPRMLREMAAKGMQPDGKGGQTFIPGGEKDPAAIARLEAAKAEGTATGKDTVAAIRTLPNAIASSQKALANIDAMLGDARVVNNQIVATQGKGPHPGFSSAVGAGIGLRFIPGTPASDFQERFREVTSGAFLEAFESLRGGGSITEKEGEKATAAKTRMNLAQSEKEFVTAAREYQSIIRDGVKRAQSRLTKAQSTSALGNVVDFGDLK